MYIYIHIYFTIWQIAYIKAPVPVSEDIRERASTIPMERSFSNSFLINFFA